MRIFQTVVLTALLAVFGWLGVARVGAALAHQLNHVNLISEAGLAASTR